eukprot:s815_g15.t1
MEKKSPSSSSYATPPPRIAAPSPKDKPTKPAKPAKEVVPPPENPAPPPTEGARMNRLRRKDRYNPKVRKYYVVYEEGDADLSEDEERHTQQDTEVPSMQSVAEPKSSLAFSFAQPQVGEDNVTFRRLGVARAESDGEGDESEKEKEATQVNSAQKEQY